MQVKIAPSLLSADFANLESEVKKIEQAGADLLHLDVMDNEFVPNLTFGAPLIKAIKKHTTLPFDVHLMVKNPSTLIDSMILAGANLISFHIEAENHADRLINYIKSKGVKAGIALNPSTSHEAIRYLLPIVDFVLVMTVNPGFGGQSFIESQLEKISTIKNIIDTKKLNVEIEVDGGINQHYAKLVKNCGANMLVAGSYVFLEGDYKNKIESIR